ncbi:MAG: DUF58 domain-containing protein [Acidobacteriota bacterium]
MTPGPRGADSGHGATAAAGRLLALWRRFLGDAAPDRAVPSDLARRLTRLELAAARRIAGPWVGAYRSAFRGLGIEFAGVREYVSGDDVRTVDWRVTARTGRLAVRRYVEERDRPVLFIVDVGPATETGSGERTLRELAAEVVAVVGSAALAAGDRVGLLAWSHRRELLLPPQRRGAVLLRMVRALLLAAPGRASDLRGALAEATRLLPHRSVVVIVAPLLDGSVSAQIAALALRHDLVVVRLWDPRSGRGTATAGIPARSIAGDPGRAATVAPPPLPVPMAGAVRALSLTPESNVPAVLARVFEPGARRFHA